MPELGNSLTRRAVLKASLALPLAPRAAAANGPAPRAAGRPHVAVVGAGAFGGWTALHLRRRGARVTLLDGWGPGNARASSGGETRVIRGLYGPDRVYVDWVVRAFALWRELERAAGQTLYRPTGALWLFRGDDGYARVSAPLARAAGLAVEELSLADAARRFPQVRFDGVREVWLEPEAGYLLARRACASVVERFVAAGGEYRELAARPGAVESGRLAPLALSDGSTLAADAYVFACGPWLGRLLPEAVGARVRPSRQEVFFFGTPAGDPRWSEERLPVWIDFGERVFYGVPGNERRGLKVADDTRGEAFDPDGGERNAQRRGPGARPRPPRRALPRPRRRAAPRSARLPVREQPRRPLPARPAPAGGQRLARRRRLRPRLQAGAGGGRARRRAGPGRRRSDPDVPPRPRDPRRRA